MKLTTFQKFKTICTRYNIYYDKLEQNIDYFILRKMMLKVYDNYHKDIEFELFVRNVYQNPLDYLYELSEKMEREVQEIDLLNNCFNDTYNKHFGVKYKGYWFFLTHRGNDYSIPLALNEFNMKHKDEIGLTYLTSYSTNNPNILTKNVGTIRTEKLEQYIKKFLK